MSSEDDNGLDLIGRIRLDTSALDGLGAHVGLTMKSVAGIAAGAFAGAEIFGWVKEGIESLQNIDRISKQSEAAIQSTGGAAGVAASHVADYADAIERKTGVESESIQEGENMLLTFTNIKNAAGKNNDIFDQATSILTDMSVAMGTDAKDGAIQLGKALNDPTQGITALTRVGVTFSEQQKEQIATMQKAGDVAGAQKIILAELNKEFGGSAAKFGESGAGQMAKFKNAMGDVQEQFASGFLPIINEFLKFGLEVLPDVTSGIADVQHAFSGFFSDFKDGWATGDSSAELGLSGITGALVDLGDAAHDIFNFVSDSWTLVVTGFQNPDLPVAIDSIQGALVVLGQAFRDIADFIEQHWQPILIAAGVSLGLLVAPTATLVAGLVYAYTHFQLFHDIVDVSMRGVIDVVQHLADFSAEIWPKISEAATHAFNLIVDEVKFFTDTVKLLWSIFGDDIIGLAKGLFSAAKDIFSGELKIIENIVKLFLDIINGDWSKAFDDLKGIVSGGMQVAAGVMKGAEAIFVGIVKGLGSAIAAAAVGIFDGVKNEFIAAINYVIDKWNDFKIPAVQNPLPPHNQITPEINFPNIKRLAKGGTALTDGFAIVGDGGNGSGTELAYLNKGATIDPRLPEIVAAAAGAGGNGGGDTYIKVDLHGVQDGDSVMGVLPDLIDALRAGTGSRREDNG